MIPLKISLNYLNYLKKFGFNDNEFSNIWFIKPQIKNYLDSTWSMFLYHGLLMVMN